MRGEGGPEGPPSFPQFKYAQSVHAGRAAGRSFRPTWNRRVSSWLPRRFRAKDCRISRGLNVTKSRRSANSQIDRFRTFLHAPSLHAPRSYFGFGDLRGLTARFDRSPVITAATAQISPAVNSSHAAVSPRRTAVIDERVQSTTASHSASRSASRGKSGHWPGYTSRACAVQVKPRMTRVAVPGIGSTNSE